MAVTVVFLGRLADVAGTGEQQHPAPLGWAAIRESWPADIVQAIDDPRVILAVNGDVLAEKGALQAADGDEVAFLPPVSGG